MDDVIPIQNKDCAGACPICCYQTLDEYNARVDAQLRNRSLTQANVVCYMLVLAHIIFAAYGRALPMPEYFYAVILVPYCGNALRKLGEVVEKIKTGDTK